MQSSNCDTHLDALLSLSECELVFSYHFGDFDSTRPGEKMNTDGQFAGLGVHQVESPELIKTGMPARYTFWFAEESYSRIATTVIASREILERINLKKPGLYPEIERAA